MVISFHSLEDRIVKQFIAKHSKEVFDRRAVCRAAAMKLIALDRIKPSEPEVAANRARAAPSCASRKDGCMILHGAPHAAAPVGRWRARAAFRRPMARLNLMLLLAVLVSALYLVHTQYQSRRLFTELDRAVAEARRLDTEHQRLQVENAPRPRHCAWKRWPAPS